MTYEEQFTKDCLDTFLKFFYQSYIQLVDDKGEVLRVSNQMQTLLTSIIEEYYLEHFKEED